MNVNAPLDTIEQHKLLSATTAGRKLTCWTYTCSADIHSADSQLYICWSQCPCVLSRLMCVCRLMTQRAHLCLLMLQLWCSHHRPAKSSSKMRYIHHSPLTVLTLCRTISKLFAGTMVQHAVDVSIRVSLSLDCFVDLAVLLVATFLQQRVDMIGTVWLSHSFATIRSQLLHAQVQA